MTREIVVDGPGLPEDLARSTPPPAPWAGLPAELWDRYQALRFLGEGASGRVYLAHDRELQRLVAIKCRRRSDERAAATRFQREATSLTRLRHPNVVRLYDYGEVDGWQYLVLEAIEGTALSTPPADLDVADLMLQVASGLEAVHDLGLVHRDVKPANVLLTAAGRAVLVDFGYAWDPGRTRITRPGNVVGTLAFMAPEVLLGAPPDAAADWFAWGATAYCLCEGRSLVAPSDLDRLARTGVAVSPRFERLSPASPMAQVITRALSPDPARRPSSRGEIERMLRPTRPSAGGVGPPRVDRPRARSLPRGLLRGLSMITLVVLSALAGGDPGAAADVPAPSPSRTAGRLPAPHEVTLPRSPVRGHPAPGGLVVEWLPRRANTLFPRELDPAERADHRALLTRLAPDEAPPRDGYDLTLTLPPSTGAGPGLVGLVMRCPSGTALLLEVNGMALPPLAGRPGQREGLPHLAFLEGLDLDAVRPLETRVLSLPAGVLRAGENTLRVRATTRRHGLDAWLPTVHAVLAGVPTDRLPPP